jgi:KDO2-lipid IV(A) lauroyltransferase
LRFIALFPLPVLYFFSTFYYFLSFYLIRYRKKVVAENLTYAFPEKSGPEIQKIAKGFYQHFCDSLFESLKVLGMSNQELNKRFRFKNLEIFEEIFNSGKSIVLVSGHQGNWEWMIGIQMKIQHKFLAIYKPLADPNFDRILKEIREKFANGGELVAMNDIYKVLIKHRQQEIKTATWFLADQTPPKDYPFWTHFMNRETPFFTGPARIARKFDQPVVFMHIKKIRRGYYEAEFTKLVEAPKLLSEAQIAEKYIRKIEDGIREQPEFWLWSHRRWKHKKESVGS